MTVNREPMTIQKAIVTVVACALLFAALGAVVGYGLGSIVPGYYRNIFPSGRNAEFDPVSVGVGQGLTQGLAGGIVLGLVLVALLSWRETRLVQASNALSRCDPKPPASTPAARRLLLVSGCILAVMLSICFGALFGLLQGQRGAYHRRYLDEKEAVLPPLREDAAFSSVEIRERSDGGIYLSGNVATHADLQQLRGIVVQAIGEERAREATRSVWVHPQQP